MYNTDSDSLNAGAPDIRLSGNQDPNQQMAMSDESNTRLLESLYEEFLGMGFSPADAARKAQEAFDQMSRAPQQNSGIMAAAPGTYTQQRKQMMAGGGIAGLKQTGKPGGLVEPGISKYGAFDFITDPIKSVYEKFVDDIIPNEIKENPVATAALLGLGANQFDLIPGEMSSQNWLGKLLGRDAVLGDTGIFEAGSDMPDLINLMPGGSYPESDNTTSNVLQDLATNYLMNTFAPGEGSSPYGLNTLLNSTSFLPFTQRMTDEGQQGMLPFGLDDFLNLRNLESLQPYLKKEIRPAVAGREAIPARYTSGTGPGEGSVLVPGTGVGPVAEQAALYEQRVNPLYPIAAGLGVGKYVSGLPKDKLPMDTTSMNPAAIAAAARGTDAQGIAAGLRFLPEQVTRAAQGGRIGYAEGGDDAEWRKIYNKYKAKQIALGQEFADFDEFVDQHRVNEAQGGRIGAEEGGLMNLGGMEKDYRNEGGFVALGGKEKADDVPARLSKNEFVFTADAVRGAGGGDIDKGAEIMEDLMNNLEGARGMFANAQKLQNRIV